ncbi:multidrug ABC transporter ATP-binding protein [Cellulomonas algicola]|uniref:Multidrug ABC transporter ATP-binding protein n=1 Tax=Cellulomonas algicola TaxID=2071633 RepID=A0A401UWS6_9CELL|nr:ABC transporter ATP-binding protein [Cellulomonas algicola]GCD19143.1 multidrug ABC transporter ATP-binding protein [Cellulomonas algicola]
MPTPVIEVEHLRKTYGRNVAVDDVSLHVQPGEIFGILGRNGAGKTTTVEIVGGLRHADAGAVRVLGLDPRRDARRLHERVGLQLQESELPPRITVREALDLYASFYEDPADPASLITDLGLTEKAGTRFQNLSGGQKQRLSVALALVGNPEIAILDELTTGLDPHARRETWGVVDAIRQRGVTIVLVTHLMEEAERLCDRIALIDAGRVVATGTPAALAARATAEQVLRFRPSAPMPAGLLDRTPTVTHVATTTGATTDATAADATAADATATATAPADGTVEVRGTDNVVQDVLVALHQHGIRPVGLHLEQGSLEDAFVALTGRASQDAGPSATTATAARRAKNREN